MGIGGISIWQLVILLFIVVLLFGTKRLRNIGGDVGTAYKQFRQTLQSSTPPEATKASAHSTSHRDKDT